MTWEGMLGTETLHLDKTLGKPTQVFVIVVSEHDQGQYHLPWFNLLLSSSQTN